ncbi:universal stress protein [Egicoccus sp. AB-alg6-2]|uniref:universal stress protein n=1 Tax=Egicoccus sp. AB-alg6-2 TaxID=3242692 RepID=UPI00359D2C6A
MDTIVVGIDASDHAVRALRWAFDEAALRGAELELVHAYVRPEAFSYPGILLDDLPSDAELEAAARQVVEDTVAKVEPRHDVAFTVTVAAGGAAGVLCDRAADAELLVVGARGLGGFRGLLLGSVSQQVVVHSPCPVVIVPPERRQRH